MDKLVKHTHKFNGKIFELSLFIMYDLIYAYKKANEFRKHGKYARLVKTRQNHFVIYTRNREGIND